MWSWQSQEISSGTQSIKREGTPVSGNDLLGGLGLQGPQPQTAPTAQADEPETPAPSDSLGLTLKSTWM